MARIWNPSDELFRVRLRALVEARGRASVARTYGRSERTVQNWMGQRTRPSADVRRRVSRTGRTVTGPSIQTRPGRPGIMDPRVIRARQMAQQNLQRTRERRLSQARTPSERQMIISTPSQVDDRVFIDLDQRRRELLDREHSGDYDDWDELYYLWEEWREDIVGSYEAISG